MQLNVFLAVERVSLKTRELSFLAKSELKSQNEKTSPLSLEEGQLIVRVPVKPLMRGDLSIVSIGSEAVILETVCSGARPEIVALCRKKWGGASSVV